MQRNLSEKRAGILNLKRMDAQALEFEESFDVIISRNDLESAPIRNGFIKSGFGC